jgi:hypothetical protein
MRNHSLLLLLLGLSLSLISTAQTTITTTATATAYWSTSAGEIVFGIGNTNSTPIKITNLSNYCPASHNATYTLWYHPTALTGLPTAISAANGWVQVPVSAPISTLVAGITPIFSSMNILLPANTTYRFALVASANGPHYAASGAGPAIFSSGGVQIHTQNSAISPTYAGYYPGPPDPATISGATPRGFYGTITFEPYGPCTDPPVPGNIASDKNPICPNANFTLSLTGGTNGTGQTFQWERSTTSSSSGFSDIAGATNASLTTSAATPTWYRVRTTCGTSTVTSTSYQITVSAGCFTYCTSTPTSTANEEIFSVTVNGSTNALPCNVVAPGAGSILNRYSNFYPNGSLTTLIPGLTVDFKIEENECDGATFFSNGCAIWIDYNRDGDFDDAGERVFFESTATLGPRNIIGNINVPATASPGLTGMRIIVAENTSGAALTPCLSYTYGETEDYLVNIGSSTPCNGTPNAGNASATPASVCLNQNVSLNATGVTILNGLSYQWQSSLDDINWTNISGATIFAASVTQTQTTYYRFIVICNNTNDTGKTASVKVLTPPLLGGTYTIDKLALPANVYPNGTAFLNFNTAYNAMKCGIISSVVFNVINGPYNEQLIMNSNIPGTNATTTVTFNGAGGIAAENTITFATTAAEPAVIKLKNGLQYFRFNNLVINPTGATNGHGVHLTSDANYNIISNCTINLNSTATGTGFAGVVISGSETSATGTGTTTALCDYNEIRNNTINGGYYGITQAATFAGGAHGYNKIIGNTITNFYQYGIYTNSTYYSVIDSNYISRPTRTNTAATVAGIYFTTNTDNATVSRNRISNPFGNQLGATAAFNGIDFSTCSATSGSPNVVTNNLIYKMNGNGAINGISNTGSANAWFAHNTISLDSLNIGTVNTRGFSLGTAAVGIIFYDNLISVTRSGPGTKMAIYLAGLLFACDYNNYYVSGPGGTSAIGFYTANRTTLALWQSNTGHDAHSLDKNPVFVDVNNGYDGYKPGNAQIDNEGLYFGTDYDILGVVRGGSPTAPAGTKPDMGAFEFIAPLCSVPPINGTTKITGASPICQASTIKLDLTILPYGSSQTFQWQSGPSATGPWTNIGGPLLYPDTLITATITQYYHAIVNCGAAIDSSDPVLVTVTPALPAGTYTINPGPGTTYIPGSSGGNNFASFNAAKTAMQTCGILGSVIFNVVSLSGPYNEQLKLDSIIGTSPNSTIIFNGNGNTIAFNTGTPPTNTERAVIKLSRADYITFDSLRIDATGAFTYGNGVQLINNADTNTFRKCTILINNSASSQNYSGIIINSVDAGTTTTGNTWCDGNTFDRNIINGGYYGVTLVGSSAQQISNNSFINNRIEDFYSTGFYIAGTYNTLIEGNIITRPSRTVVTTTYGIHVTSAESPRLRISKNRIFHLFAAAPTNTASQYGIYHNTVDVTAGNDNIVSNNLIHSLEGNGIIYALYNTSSDGVKYQHNTVSLDMLTSNSSFATRGFYQTGSAIGIEFVNNIITITRGGTGTRYGIYLETAASEVTSDRNDFYVKGTAGTNYFGYGATGNRLTLAAWQSATTKDANSFEVDPVYVDSANGNYAPGIQTIDNQGSFVGIATDILNNIRDPFTPDIGAYEFVPITCTNPPVAGTASVTPSSGICLEAPITLNLSGNSQIGTLTFQWQSSPTGLPGTWVNIGPILYSPQFNTTTGSNTYYRAEVICGSGTPAYSTVVQVLLNNVVLAGTYTIDNSQPTTWPGPSPKNFNSFNDAVNAMSCGITGPVVFNVMPGTTSGVYNEQVNIPYIKNSSAINTITFQSNSGVPSSSNLTFAGTAANNYTLKLAGAKYITFQNMTIIATNPSYGRVIELFDTASYNNFLNNVIVSPTVVANTNSVTGVYANPLKGSRNLIKGNTVTGGATGIYIWGTSATNLTVDNIIDSNTVSGAYAYGIYANFHKRAKIWKNTVNVTAPSATTSYGIYASDCDSSYTINLNKVNINAATTTVYGIYVNNSDSALNNWGNIIGNNVTATANAGGLYGLYVTTSPGHKVWNNVISINTSAAVSYGIYNNNVSSGLYYNNSVNITSPNAAATNVVARFENSSATGIFIRNNIFSHIGGGRALYIANPVQPFGSNYNMLYTTGSVLIQRGTPATNFANLETWRKTTYWDVYSISGITPQFVSATDLHPNLNNPDVWAMHGRGIQIKGYTSDIDGKYRPDSLTAGVPDLGAYEFFPTALPTVLNPTPAGTPATGLTQSFLYGTDTVMKITWGANAPSSVSVRRYSGVQPPKLASGYPSADSMFFYTEVETPGNKQYDGDMKLFYIDPWQGSIPAQWMIGLGRNTPGNNWVVGLTSKVDINKKTITQPSLTFLDKFTGFLNPAAPPILPDKDTSNRGKRFWVAYPINQLNGGQDMRLYLSAQQPANVKVIVQGTSPTWERQYLVPANTVVPTESLVKTGPLGSSQNTFINVAGLHDQGIYIESDEPIVVYAHVTGSASSGAAMVLPISTWGYEYKTLGITQQYGAGSYSFFYVIADNDNTVVQITPTVPVQNAGMTANTLSTVTLNKGQVFLVVASSQTQELTGSTVKVGCE